MYVSSECSGEPDSSLLESALVPKFQMEMPRLSMIETNPIILVLHGPGRVKICLRGRRTG